VGFLKGRHPYFDVEPGTGAEGAPGPPEAGAR
jgi:hypothetical protein